MRYPHVWRSLGAVYPEWAQPVERAPGLGDEAQPGGWGLDRDVRIEACSFVLDVMVDERLPLVVERHAAQAPQGLVPGSIQYIPARSIRSFTTWRQAPSITPDAMG